MGSFGQTATKFQENVEIKPEMFTVPAGVKVEEIVKDARIIKAPMMMEDLDVYEDENGEQRLITLTESACNKYILGKFLFYTKIVTVKIK